ncbi:AMP-binding protein [Desulfovibrio sp. SGI.169]|uniref:AMP-binding protein n=1 Tax=Desulfovibrio sp. SGI.169 TaxID=3420561 RepID=UPI003D02EACD
MSYYAARGRVFTPRISVAPEQLAYLIYTSGSTGKPKGVMLRHAGICNYVTAHERNAHVAALAQDAHAMLSVTTVAFDMFLKESMTTLCNGLTLVLANDDEARDPVRLARLFAATGADAFNATPSRLVEYAEYPPLLEALNKCRVLMAGAEKYPEALLRKLRTGSARLFNTYGPTEITVSCNCKELTNADKVTVGAPLLNVREHVVDGDGNVLPCGMIGELLVGGIGVAAGYNNLPGQTAARFINFAGQRAYRTGDYARWTENGEIAILGRNDSQVKLRGLRIELGEVENVLASLPGVSACVAGIRVLNGQEHLCAWYTGEATDPQGLRERAAGTLPGYMTPTAWVHLEKMPSLPNGKTDFRNLPNPVPLASGGYAAPKTETERKICAVFAAVLGLETVGATDGFFDLGGSSLAVARVLIEAERASLSGIAYADVFAHPTPRELAACLAARNAPADVAAAPQTSPETPEGEYTTINWLLRENTLESFRAGQERPLGNVLLTGPAGFLGSHILHGLITRSDGAICCLMRRGRYESAEKRLKQILYYYFEDDFEQLFGRRLTVVEGDITRAADLARIDALQSLKIDTIINCAANVSHFSRGSDIADVNLGGVRNLIDLGLRLGARLVQISTASVAGFSIDGEPAPDTRLTERDLYIGQNLDNQYVRSKFLAEKAILEAASRGLDAKIMRVGNLMARNHDGEFQINLRSNSFIGRLRAWHVIGGFPYSSFLHHTELAPIDCTARAVLLLAAAPEACRIFHPFNNHSLFMGDIVEAMREEGIDIPLMEDEEFAHAMARVRNDPDKAERLVTLLAYNNMADGRAAVPLAAASAYTAQALLRHGWRWPETGGVYLRNFIRALSGMVFFDM